MTGIRVEELTELSHHSLIQYKLPATGELIPLPNIAPSKADAERLLVAGPELAEAVYLEEAISGHRAFIARRRAARPSEEYRTPTDKEWAEFICHFERRKLALGDYGRAWGTSCIHEHSCLRCPLLRIDPAQRPRLEEIRGSLLARITEGEHEGWHGEAEGLKVSLAGAEQKRAQLDALAARRATVRLGMPAFPGIAART